MKTCARKICNNKFTPNYKLRNYCSEECRRAWRNTERFDTTSEPLRYKVYYIPAHHYVGYSKDPYRRLLKHQNMGKDITDAHIIEEHDNMYQALEAEAKYHGMGYAGCREDNLTYTRELYAH